MANHSGQWQAQGDDIKTPPNGHCVTWGHGYIPTKSEGHGYLDQVIDKCQKKEKKLREDAEIKARRFIDRSPPEGYPTASKHFYCNSDVYKNARIDLEIYGMAFCDGV